MRIAPRFGPGDALEHPSQEWAVGVIQKLAAQGWRIDSLSHPGPCYHPDKVDVTFLVPGGRVREFERAALVNTAGFARIIRAA